MAAVTGQFRGHGVQAVREAGRSRETSGRAGTQVEQDEPRGGEKAEERGTSISVRELMDESRRAFEQIMRIVMGLPAEDLFRPQPYEWTGGNPVGTAIPAYTVEYYQRHYGPIRRWMTKRRRRNRR